MWSSSPPPELVAALEESRRLGFLGPGPVGPHLVHALGFARAWGRRSPAAALDLGSGGGVPGLVLAAWWPGTRWVLLDAMARRTAFLDRVGPGIGNVTVVRERAEVYAASHRATVELVTARSFGPPAVTAECAAPLLRPGGLLVVSEPPDEEARWPVEPLAALGLRPLRIVAASARYRVLVQAEPCPQRFPRRTGVPAKRPLF